MTVGSTRPRARGLRIAVRISVAVVAVALLWLVVVLGISGTSGWPTEGPLAVIADLLLVVLAIGWMASIVGVVLGFVALGRTGERRMLVVAVTLLPVAIVGSIAALLVGSLYVLYTHPFVDNPAADAGRPLSAALREHGGSELCTAGDPGLGPDNVQPWYNAWVEVPTASATGPAFARALEQAHLTPSPNRMGVGTRGSATATIDRLGSTDVEIDCSSGFEQWGHHHTAAPGNEVLEVQVSLPLPNG